MRILVAQPGPAFSVADVYNGWCDALLGLGCQVARYNLDDRLTFFSAAEMPSLDGGRRKAFDPEVAVAHAVTGICADMYRFRPDLLLVVSGFFMPPDLLDLVRSYGTRVALLHTESPYEDERQLCLAGHADLNLVNDPTNIDRYKAVAPTVYMPHAYRPEVHHPGPAVDKLICDLGFVGTGYPSRVDYLERMGLDGLDVLLAGNWQVLAGDSPLRPYVGHDLDKCLDNADAVDIYRSMRCGLNVYRREAERPELSQGWAMGPREVEMAACGAFFLREPRGEGDDVLWMLPTVDSPEEAGQLLRWWLERPEARERVAEQARAAIADRTFDHHAAELLRLLDARE